MSDANVNIKSTHNDPIVGLIAQVTQLKSQTSEHAKYDLDVTSFNGLKADKDEEMKLYIPVETYVNYLKYPTINNCDREIINLLIISCFLAIIFIIISSRR
jgi:hypothetical protein